VSYQGWRVKSHIATIAFGLFVRIAWGQVNSASLEKPSLEDLARRPGARVIRSKEVAHLESSESHAVVTTLVVEDSAQEGRWMRGVRVDLLRPYWKRTLYIEESSLQALKRIFDQLTLDIERVLLFRPTGYGYVGSCEFRDTPGLYPLAADFDLSWPALRVFGPNGEELMFPGLMPSHLSKALSSAIDDLKAH